MQFSFSHEFDIPLDALELAALSPDLATKMAPSLDHMTSVTVKSHRLAADRLERVLIFQPNLRVPSFAQGVITREMTSWDERSIYDLKRHRSEWSIEPHVKMEWRRYFRAQGTYELDPLGEGRTRRVVAGTVLVNVRVVREVAERLIVAELKRVFEVEAAALRELATLS